MPWLLNQLEQVVHDHSHFLLQWPLQVLISISIFQLGQSTNEFHKFSESHVCVLIIAIYVLMYVSLLR